MHVANEMYLSNNLEMLGTLHPDTDVKIGSAFGKFSIITSELAGLMKTLVSVPVSVILCLLFCFLTMWLSTYHCSDINTRENNQTIQCILQW